MQYWPMATFTNSSPVSHIAVHHHQRMALADCGLTMEFGV